MVNPTQTVSLDTAGVAGLIGGDDAAAAMAIMHVYEGSKWLGWYNSPGSYQVAARLAQLTGSRFLDGLFPGINVDPASLFGPRLNGNAGPKYIAAHSGTVIPETGPCGPLFMRASSGLVPQKIEGRQTVPIAVTVAELTQVPESTMYPAVQRIPLEVLATIPISISITACVASACFHDMLAASMILLGIVASGVSCWALGSGKLMFGHPSAAQGSPSGDGLLMSEHDIVVVKGPEGAVNSVTRGRFGLHFGELQYAKLGLCSTLLTAQFVLQLLLIPQCSLFGQIMIVATFAASGAYNTYLASSDKEQIQLDVLLQAVLGRPVMRKYSLGTRTAMVAFVMLVMRPTQLERQLDEMLPNDTAVWKFWKSSVAGMIRSNKPLEFSEADWNVESLDETERQLLKTLFGDAQAAYQGYVQHIQFRKF